MTTSRVTPRLLSASTITSESVRNSAGEDLGKIEEIMIDLAHSRVAYAVLSFGGFLGIGDKYFAVPLEALTFDPVNRQFFMEVDRERLENAPGFDKDNWPDTVDYGWAAGVYEHYGHEPYWS